MGPSDADKIKNAATMFGTGSKQHKAAQARFGGTGAKSAPKKTITPDPAIAAGHKAAADARVKNAATMFGTGSKQHKAAQARFGSKGGGGGRQPRDSKGRWD